MTETAGTIETTEQDVSVSPSLRESPKDPLDMTEVTGMTETTETIEITKG